MACEEAILPNTMTVGEPLQQSTNQKAIESVVAAAAAASAVAAAVAAVAAKDAASTIVKLVPGEKPSLRSREKCIAVMKERCC